MSDDPKTTAKHRNQIAAEVIADASAFAAWWTKRHHPVAVDEVIVIQAQAAGLLYRGSGMLRLSPSGLKLTSTTGVQQVMAETPTTALSVAGQYGRSSFQIGFPREWCPYGIDWPEGSNTGWEPFSRDWLAAYDAAKAEAEANGR